MPLTPEERRKIYEEEKARIEAEEQARKDSRSTGESTLDRLSPNLAGLLCYLGGWVTGIIFLVLEEKNRTVRFHASQSLILFGSLNLLSILLGWIPRVGGIFSGLILAFAFIFWIVLMVKAYQGELYKIPVIGDIADALAQKMRPGNHTGEPVEIKPSQPAAVPEEPGKKIGRMTASAVAIGWSVVLLIAFNFFHQYIAYYDGETFNDVTTWTRYPLFTNDIHLWLPVLTTTLVLSIIGHIMLIIYDKYLLRELITMILDVFGLATVLTLLYIFPFDFSVIPDGTAADITSISVTMVLIFIAVGIGVGILVRLIKLISRIASGKAHY
jgi:uncharacterized membrane protein